MYKLGPPIRNKLFNYKPTVQAINSDDPETFGTGLSSCDCHNSEFADRHHGHVITGDLRMIRNNKLRKLMTKGPNFREARTINWSKCKETIASGLDTFISKYDTSNDEVKTKLLEWKTLCLEKVDKRVSSIKKQILPKRTCATLKDPIALECYT